MGETSQPIRSRVKEYLEKRNNLSPDSLIVDNWSEIQGTQMVTPELKFEVLSQHKDPLSRQLREAIIISEQGKLSRVEFSSNELIRLDPTRYSWDDEKENNGKVEEKRNTSERIRSFFDYMKNVERINKINNHQYI